MTHKRGDHVALPKEFPTESVDTEELLQNSLGMLEKREDIGTAMVNFIKVSVFNEAYGSNWDLENDNELLGIRELTKGEIEALVRESL